MKKHRLLVVLVVVFGRGGLHKYVIEPQKREAAIEYLEAKMHSNIYYSYTMPYRGEKYHPVR